MSELVNQVDDEGVFGSYSTVTNGAATSIEEEEKVQPSRKSKSDKVKLSQCCTIL